MDYQNGQTVSDVKKATSNFTSDAKSVAADVKSGAKKLGSDLKSDLKSEFKSDSKDLKGEVKAAGSKVEKIADSAISQGSSIANTVIASVSSFLPVKTTDEALEMLQSSAEDVQASLMTARDSAASFIKKYPFYSLLGAAVIGAAAVMLISPRKSTADLH